MGSITSVRRVALCLSLLLAVSAFDCVEPVCGCSSPQAIAVVYGAFTQAGGPVANLYVVAESVGCGSPPVHVSGAEYTDPDGEYRIVVGGVGTDTACLVVSTRRVPGVPPTPLNAASPLRVRLAYQGPPDSIRFDYDFPAVPGTP